MPAALVTEQLTVTVPGRTLVAGLTISIAAGMFVAVLGKNGCGKSLSMLTLAGLRPAHSGRVSLHGRTLTDWTPGERARTLALMPQLIDDRFPQTVLETARVGRYPHVPRFGWETERDHTLAEEALAAVDLETFADRDILGLSGGERRRLAMAQILAQDPDVFLLDEPTNHLDPQHQQDAMCLFKRRCEAGKAVVASLHDVNLASRFADYCLLLDGDGDGDGDGNWTFGPTKEVLSRDSLSALYGVSMRELRDGAERWFVADGGPQA